MPGSLLGARCRLSKRRVVVVKSLLTRSLRLWQWKASLCPPNGLIPPVNDERACSAPRRNLCYRAGSHYPPEHQLVDREMREFFMNLNGKLEYAGSDPALQVEALVGGLSAGYMSSVSAPTRARY